MSKALLLAIIMVESSGRPDAVNGDAVGILQIRPIMVKDCNRILKAPVFSLEDRWDPEASQEMFRIYTNHYSHGQSAEVIARRWYGGPRGETKQASEVYWQKVQNQLRKEKP